MTVAIFTHSAFIYSIFLDKRKWRKIWPVKHITFRELLITGTNFRRFSMLYWFNGLKNRLLLDNNRVQERSRNLPNKRVWEIHENQFPDFISSLSSCWNNYKPFINIVRFFRIIDGTDEQVDEPTERVLVHRLNVSEISNGKEQHC